MSSILSLIEAAFMAFVDIACGILRCAFQRQDELFERDYGPDSFASGPYFDFSSDEFFELDYGWDLFSIDTPLYDGDFSYDDYCSRPFYDPPRDGAYDIYSDPYDLNVHVVALLEETGENW